MTKRASEAGLRWYQDVRLDRRGDQFVLHLTQDLRDPLNSVVVLS